MFKRVCNSKSRDQKCIKVRNNPVILSGSERSLAMVRESRPEDLSLLLD